MALSCRCTSVIILSLGQSMLIRSCGYYVARTRCLLELEFLSHLEGRGLGASITRPVIKACSTTPSSASPSKFSEPYLHNYTSRGQFTQ